MHFACDIRTSMLPLNSFTLPNVIEVSLIQVEKESLCTKFIEKKYEQVFIFLTLFEILHQDLVAI